VVVAVDDAPSSFAGHDPSGLHIPELQLLFHAMAYRVARHVAAQHLGGLRKTAPLPFGQPVDILQHKVRFVTAASLFDGHDASINIMRRILQAAGAPR
jgi:hypothetical protein